MEMMPATINCKLMKSKYQTMQSSLVDRVMVYNVSSRLASGEYNVKCRLSDIVSFIKFDVAGSEADSVFHHSKYKDRLKDFASHHTQTMEDIKRFGSPSRIEVAFRSPRTADNTATLVQGVYDVLHTSLMHTKVYNPALVVKLVSFALSGVLSKMNMLCKMLDSPGPPLTCDIYDELLQIRPEVGALLKTWYSGARKLGNTHLPSPKNATMAGRLILSSMSCTPKTNAIRNACLVKSQRNYFTEFIDNLRDVDGNPHVRIDNPMFRIASSFDIFHQQYVCGRACDKCWKVFASAHSLQGFKSHSCLEVTKGNLIDVTSARFLTYHNILLSKRTNVQHQLQHLIDDTNHNIFLTGYAGTGKSFVMMCAIQSVLIKHGMNSYAVISPTKVAAGLVNGTTYHSFLRLSVGHKDDINYSVRVVEENARKHALHIVENDKWKAFVFRYSLKYIFVDEAGMLSHDQITFMDHLFREIRGNRVPFGGVRIILSGDLLQIPPVVHQKHSEGRHPEFFIESESFKTKEADFVLLYLKQSLRQKAEDIEFVRMLNIVRNGRVTTGDCDVINTYGKLVPKAMAIMVLNTLLREFDEEYKRKQIEQSTSTSFTKLCNQMKYFWNPKILPKRVLELEHSSSETSSESVLNDALSRCESILVCDKSFTAPAVERSDEIPNTIKQCFVVSMEHTEINSLAKELSKQRKGLITHVCRSRDLAEGGTIPFTSEMEHFAQSECRLETKLELSMLQTVFYTSNDIDRNLANNGMGRITGFHLNGNDVEYIIVEPILSDERLHPHATNIYRKTKETVYKGSNITRMQFPLKAADSGTLYTVQGVTFVHPYIVNTQRHSKTGYGKIYVALSRATSSDLVFFLHRLSVNDVVAHPVALQFDEYHRNRVPEEGGISKLD
jgi:hypothetical protein